MPRTTRNSKRVAEEAEALRRSQEMQGNTNNQPPPARIAPNVGPAAPARAAPQPVIPQAQYPPHPGTTAQGAQPAPAARAAAQITGPAPYGTPQQAATGTQAPISAFGIASPAQAAATTAATGMGQGSALPGLQSVPRRNVYAPYRGAPRSVTPRRHTPRRRTGPRPLFSTPQQRAQAPIQGYPGVRRPAPIAPAAYDHYAAARTESRWTRTLVKCWSASLESDFPQQ